MAYGISTTQGYLTSTEVAARLDASVPLQIAHRVSIRELETNMCSYSNEDFDVLSAALNAVGKTEIPTYAAGWVKAQLAKLDSEDRMALECEVAALALLAERGEA